MLLASIAIVPVAEIGFLDMKCFWVAVHVGAHVAVHMVPNMCPITVPAVSLVHVIRHAAMMARSVVWHRAGCAGIWFQVQDLVAIGTSDIADVRITHVTGSWPGVLRNCRDMRAKLVAIGDLCLPKHDTQGRLCWLQI